MHASTTFRNLGHRVWALALLLASAWLLPARQARAQESLSFASENYAGVLALDINPAFMVGSPYKVDVLLGGTSLNFSNDFLAVKWDYLLNSGNYPRYQDGFVMDTTPGIKSLYFNNSVYLPSAMIPLNDKMAFGLTFRLRNLVYATDIDMQIARLMFNDFESSQDWNQVLQSDGLNAQAASYSETGLAFAATVWDIGDHRINVGGRLKLLFGLGAAYIQADNLRYLVYNADSLRLNTSTTFQAGYSDNFGDFDQLANYNYAFQPAISAGVDLGISYEWRPGGDGGQGKSATNDIEAPYVLKAGLSLLDFGAVRFRQSSRSVNLAVPANSAQTLAHEWSIRGISFNNYQDIYDTLVNRFQQETIEPYFTVALPAAISVQVDHMIYKRFYVNLTYFQTLRLGQVAVRDLTSLTITPRFESRWFGAALPLQLSGQGKVHVGLALRAGPVLLGLNSIETFFSKISSAQFFFGLRIPIYKKRKP